LNYKETKNIMPIHNKPLYDSTLSAIAAVNGAWLTDPTSADYSSQANVAVAIATEVDALIPIIPTGATLSQRTLLESIVKSVMVGRSPTSLVATDYLTVAQAIAAIFAQFSTKLQDTGTGSASGVAPVNKVLFVDAANYTLPPSSQNGTLSNPFENIGNALLLALSNLWNSVIIMVAPGIYSDDLTIPGVSLSSVVISGWTNVDPNLMATDTPSISGDTITVAEDTILQFANCNVSVNNITSTDSHAVDLSVSFCNCFVDLAVIAGDELLVSLENTILTGDVSLAGNTSTQLTTDGFSWSSIVSNGVVVNPDDYSRRFRDTGADTYGSSLTATGLAIGGTVLVDCDYPGVRPGEYAIGTALEDPSPADFSFSFHHTTEDHVFFALTNISRVSTNFNEAIRIAVLHESMAQVPVP
jgi:hypothetical protein